MGASNAILEAAAAAVAEVLGAHDLSTAEPVAARFREAAVGSCGVAITVRLRDPANAPVARRVISERFGNGANVDVFNIA